jgi:hypothetical protein
MQIYVPPQNSTDVFWPKSLFGSSNNFSMGTPIATTRTGSGYALNDIINLHLFHFIPHQKRHVIL